MNAGQREDRHWSQTLPPHTALTFAAVYDPVEGLITFSGAHLLETDRCDRVVVNTRRPVAFPRRDDGDNRSQALTIDLIARPSVDGTRSTARVLHDTMSCAPSAWPYDAQTDTDTMLDSQYLPTWLGVSRGLSTGLNSPAIASSAALTAVFHDAESLRALRQHLRGMQWKCMPVPRNGSPCCGSDEDHVTDEGFFEARHMCADDGSSIPVLVNLNLQSAFSVTTTSTNNYIEVDFPSDFEMTGDGQSSWETLYDADNHFCMNMPSMEGRRRLRKPRSPPRPPSTLPADPAEVLARQQYNHLHPSGTPPPSPASTLRKKASIAKARALLDKLGKIVKNESGDESGWVCVDVTPKRA
ncbi:uncharacterized protein LAESUDRAFT_86628 [Laetiporus sulphureus 93-53]|uniref:Uncharacterized protein n=1 Tax=Laetiporus sulphureus 93-53 TaxID=1314785 RepID=A0A165EVJ3_9APHY|nr:uncharacterized protein LAESUDRAFT_86628 [Laetiporus sulphureus 93-53]KZT07853.1 hypothetical protein LAESUDRAFT_86628 [Laetiporus sulphureus 93-53]